MRHFIRSIYITLAALILIGGSQYLYAWTAPTSGAPNNNTPAPLHVGSGIQNKTGGIGLGGLLASSSAVFTGGVKITTGQPGLGKVLVSDDAGNASWKSFSEIIVATKNKIKLDTCPAGSAKMTLSGRTFCGYERTTGGVGYCDPFGQEYDTQVACWDIGHGRNHGINAYPQGCQAWEGDENYGGQGALFYCEKKSYTPKTSEDCTLTGAVLGSISEPAFSSSPILTCAVYTPYTYYFCEPNGYNWLGNKTTYDTGTLSGTTCLVTTWIGSRTYPATLGHATTTVCGPGWIEYKGTCI